MKEKYLNERYEPPRVEIWKVTVELGFGASGGSGGGSTGGGGSTTDDPLYDFGGSTVTGMPVEPF